MSESWHGIMAKVTFILPNGVSRVTEVGVGSRLVSGAFALGLDDAGFGECGGNCCCGTCHVRVKQGRFLPPAADEQAVLDTFPRVFPDSRLACQLTVREDTGDVLAEWVS